MTGGTFLDVTTLEADVLGLRIVEIVGVLGVGVLGVVARLGACVLHFGLGQRRFGFGQRLGQRLLWAFDIGGGTRATEHDERGHSEDA